uniref:proline racemase family protein n=1 Tax=Rubripirellula lacrimiformis TaxID=1930273 RepID=UPI0011A9414C
MQTIEVIDSHTAGEPTRVVVAGVPDLGGGSVRDQLNQMRDRFDHFRTAIVHEPRGSDVMVGALLCTPSDPDADIGVIFFNNVGYLGMCGHGMIGVAETLRHLGRMDVGLCRVETSVGIVNITLHDDRSITISNVESYRVAKDVVLSVDRIGTVTGDVAWGGNWFFLVKSPTFGLSAQRIPQLQQNAASIRRAINQQGYPDVDHVELFSDATDEPFDSQNFVLCPGLEYDRSPCGTGTSAKLACLAADGKLQPGQRWVQAGILGTTFAGQYDWSQQSPDRIVPRITGNAHVTAESRLRLDPRDPFAWGIRR